MPTVDCDRCEDGSAFVAIWDDDILCGRIDAICEHCYRDGHRIRRPIEPPYDEDGNLYPHLQRVDCEYCDSEHIVKVTKTFYFCPRARSEHDTEEVDDALDVYMFRVGDPPDAVAADD